MTPRYSPIADPAAWLTIPEVASRLRVSRMTAYRLVHAGTLPAHRIGRGFRIHPDDLAAYLAAARTTT